MSASAHCVFTGCNRPLRQDTEGWWRHAEQPPAGVARHAPHLDAGGTRVVDLTELADPDPAGAVR